MLWLQTQELEDKLHVKAKPISRIKIMELIYPNTVTNLSSIIAGCGTDLAIPSIQPTAEIVM